MKKVLIIGHAFPPAAGSGIRRIAAITKYLPLYGWEPIVLTTGECFYPKIDKTSYQEIPKNIKVIRTNAFAPVYHEADRKNLLKTTPSRILRGILNKIYVPDIYLGRFPFAIKEGLKLIKKEDIDIMFSSAPPFSEHLIGYFLKKITKRPWVADFRDPWTQNLESFAKKNIFKRKIEEEMEKRVLFDSNKIIVISPLMKKDFSSKYPLLSPNKFEVITNGFDSQQLLASDTSLKQKFIIVYTGSFTRARENILNNFLKALKLVIKQKPKIKQNMEINFIGSFPIKSKLLLQDLKLGSIVKIIGQVSHRKSLEAQLNSNLLLSMTPRREVTGKIFEYIKAGRPIFALVQSDSYAGEIIKRTNTGKVVMSDDINGIKNALEYFYNQFKKDKIEYSPNPEEVNKFNWEHLTKKFAIIFNKFTKK